MKYLKLGTAILALILSMSANAAIVGGFDGSRTLGSTYSIYSTTSSAYLELTNTSNFSQYGDAINFSSSTNTVTDAYLSGVDIFFTGLLRDSSALSSSEVTSLTNFINGGGVVISYGDNTGFDMSLDALLNNFGLDIINTSNNTVETAVTITTPSHPVVNGPFGTVGTHAIRDSARLGAASGDAQIIGSYADGFGAIGVVDPNGGSRLGGLLFLPDSETYGLTASDFRDLPDARNLFNNGVAWAVDIANAPAVVPIPGAMWLFGTGLIGLIGFAKRKKA